MDAAHEQTLIGRAKQGDDVAYEELMVAVVGPAHKLACGLLHDSHLAEDAVQDAALNAWRGLKQLKPGAALRPWFLAIVANRCRDMKRGHWGRLSTTRFRADQPAPPDEAAFQRAQIREVLRDLHEDQRLVLVLHYYLDLPWPEVAATAGLTEAGARSRLYRALEKIRAVRSRAVTG